MEGGRGGSLFFVAAGRDGEDKLFFDALQNGQGGNFVVRCRPAKPETFLEAGNFATVFTELRDGVYARPHDGFVNDDTRGPLAGGLLIDNAIELEERDGYILCSPLVLQSGWTGGISSPATDKSATFSPDP